MLGGLAAGFLGAGLIGMLMGNGFMGGMAGFASMLGLLLQIGLVVLRRLPGVALVAAPFAAAAAGLRRRPGDEPRHRSRHAAAAAERLGSFGCNGFGMNGHGAPAADVGEPIEIKPEDFDAFERTLGDVQTAYSNEDLGRAAPARDA